MEEKERYVYHEVSNEVEAYECYWDNQECCELFDDKAVLNRLNEQDYELKKLNQENIKLIKENKQLKLAEELLIKQEKEYDEQLEKQSKIHYRHLKEKNQDKISFAIAELEKVKGLIANHTQELWTCENDDIDVVLYEEIDNQIKQLKEMK